MGAVLKCGDVSLACGRGVLTFAREGAKFIGIFRDGTSITHERWKVVQDLSCACGCARAYMSASGHSYACVPVRV